MSELDTICAIIYLCSLLNYMMIYNARYIIQDDAAACILIYILNVHPFNTVLLADDEAEL